MVTFLGKCTFSTKVILFPNDFAFLPRAREVLVARRSERQSRETSHSLGACFSCTIDKKEKTLKEYAIGGREPALTL